MSRTSAGGERCRGLVTTARAIVADHDRDDLADEAHDVLRQHRPAGVLVETERRGPERRQVDVLGGQDLHSGQLLGRARVDPVDLRVREQRPDEGDLGSAFESEVLDVRAAAAEEAIVLGPQHSIPEDAHGQEPITATAPESRQTFG